MSSSSSSRAVGASATSVPDEYDSTDREAQFFLFTRPLEDAVLGHAEHLELHHWALVVIFEDESVRTLEAFESGGKLTPTFSKESPKNLNGYKYWRLGLLKTSPLKLHKVVKNHSLNGSDYQINTNNCQHWVKAAVRDISSNLSKALDEFRTNDGCNILNLGGMCSWASSRSSSNHVVSFIKNLTEGHWSSKPSTTEVHHLD
ncbi:uncharacterized protein [Rhodnius prolixus]|uniref:Uncharacterized protein n=1 Tax=Rhodnius prolixus TaxID=13249 RepID=T1HPG3_RHOPR